MSIYVFCDFSVIKLILKIKKKAEWLTVEEKLVIKKYVKENFIQFQFYFFVNFHV